MHYACYRTIALLAALSASYAVFASDRSSPEDRAAVAKCLADKAAAGEGRESCVGVIADACLQKSEDPSTHGMADCSRREHDVWDERLNAAYRKLMTELEPAQRAKLREMQRAWIAFSDAKCGFHRVMQPEGTIIIPIAAYCDMTEVGRQAVFLETMIEEGDSR